MSDLEREIDPTNACPACGLWFHKQKCPRPREKWQKKDPKEKGKRKRGSNSSKGPKRANGSSNFKSDAQTPASDDSSPTDTATEAPDAEENENEALSNDEPMADYAEPQLPPMPRTFRASSADPEPRGLQARTRHRGSDRQVRSSPGQAPAHGSEGAPIEADLTPKPVRRQLFPSPEKGQVRADPGATMTMVEPTTHLPAFVRRSPRLNKTRDVFGMPSGAVAVTVDGKENVTPAIGAIDDGLADLFEEGPVDVELPPMTPTPKRRSERLLKTPSKTPQRQFGADVSPNVGLLPSFRTPRSKQGQHPALAALLGTVQKNVLEMTPFTRSIHDALTSEAPYALAGDETSKAALPNEARQATPKKAITFDFPDLPSLKNSSPISHDQLINFNFSELTTDHLTSDFHDPFAPHTTMTSSPPAGLFNFLDPSDAAVSLMWDDMIEADAAESSYEDPEALAMSTSIQPLRRSPRQQRLKPLA